MDAWQAIAEPSRRRILLLLAAEDLAAGEIAAHFTATRSAVSQHLAVLRAAGLVQVVAEGRRRVYRIDRRAMEQVRGDIEAFWTSELAAVAREAFRLADNARSTDDERNAG
ncbi:MAG: metalloregulator ArsR/SmtB family transcription factor [Propionibacteriales bacterium]|nr:metalloregulator ArsR/SmtB family transcription factor [Propionibacteriales bacterium]